MVKVVEEVEEEIGGIELRKLSFDLQDIKNAIFKALQWMQSNTDLYTVRKGIEDLTSLEFSPTMSIGNNDPDLSEYAVTDYINFLERAREDELKDIYDVVWRWVPLADRIRKGTKKLAIKYGNYWLSPTGDLYYAKEGHKAFVVNNLDKFNFSENFLKKNPPNKPKVEHEWETIRIGWVRIIYLSDGFYVESKRFDSDTFNRIQDVLYKNEFRGSAVLTWENLNASERHISTVNNFMNMSFSDLGSARYYNKKLARTVIPDSAIIKGKIYR